MEITRLFPGSWGSNCYILSSGDECAVVDPSPTVDTLLSAIDGTGCRLSMILLTHGHFDHIVSLDALRDRTGAPAWIHQSEVGFPADAHQNAFYTFFQMERVYRPTEHGFIDGDILTLGAERIRALHTPGHTQGSSCFLLEDGRLLTGDTLFASGYGRYDLYSGDGETLFRTLKTLKELPAGTRIYPGHGESATLGDALRSVGL